MIVYCKELENSEVKIWLQKHPNIQLREKITTLDPFSAFMNPLNLQG